MLMQLPKVEMLKAPQELTRRSREDLSTAGGREDDEELLKTPP